MKGNLTLKLEQFTTTAFSRKNLGLKLLVN